MDALGIGFFALVLQFWILLAAGQGRIFFFLINERFQINYIVYYSIVYTVRISLQRMSRKIFRFNECYLNS